MVRQNLHILSLAFPEDEILTLQESLSQNEDINPQFTNVTSFSEYENLNHHQAIECILVAFPAGEDIFRKWISPETHEPVVVFVNPADQCTIQKHIRSSNIYNIVRDPGKEYIKAASSLIKWLLRSGQSIRYDYPGEQIITNLNLAYLRLDHNGKIIYANEIFCGYLNCRKTEIIGTAPYEWVLSQPELFQEKIEEALRTHSLQNLETRIRWKNESIKWIDWNISPEDSGQLTCIGRDVTSDKKSISEMQNLIQQFRMIADFTYDWEYWMDPNFNLVYISPSCQRMTGFPPSAFIENPNLLLTIVYPVDRAKVKKHIQEEKEAQGSELEFRITTRTGETRWIGHICQPIFDESGVYYGQRVSNRDISEKKHTERILREQRNLAINLSMTNHQIEALEEVLKSALQIHPIDCGWIHLVGAISQELNLVAYKGLLREFANQVQNFPATSPFTRRMMKGVPVYINYDNIREGFEGIWFPSREELRSAASIPVFYRGKIIATLNFGSHSYTEIPQTTRDILEGIGAQLGGVIARTKAEYGMEETLSNLQLLFNTLECFLFVLDLNGKIIYYNPTVQERLGYPETELLTYNIQDLLPARMEKEGISITTDLLDGLVDRRQLSFITQKGMIIPVEISIIKGKWGEENVMFCIANEIPGRNK